METSTNRSLGILLDFDGSGRKLIYNFMIEDMTFPVNLQKTLYTKEENQSTFHIYFFENHENARYAKFEDAFQVGEVTLKLKENLPKTSPVILTFTMREKWDLCIKVSNMTGDVYDHKIIHL